MDPQTIGQLGGWIGGGLGVLGGLIGTYFSIRNTNSPRERAFVIKAALVTWIFLTMFIAALFLIPTWHKHLLWIVYGVGLVAGIQYWNHRQFRIREEDARRGTAE